MTAIRGVSLDLVEGEVLALVGESGLGKSVLTKTFTGMLEENGHVASGSIDYRGQDLTKLKSHRDWASIRRAKIATIFQDPYDQSLTKLRLSVAKLLEVIVKHQGKISHVKLKKWPLITWTRLVFLMLKNVSNEYPFQYSGGMRQTYRYCHCLGLSSDVLILLTTNNQSLDVTIHSSSNHRPLEITQRVSTVLSGFSLPMTLEWYGIADKVAVKCMLGEIIEYATVEEIFYEPCHPYTWSLLSKLCSWPMIRGSFSQFQGHHHHFIHQLLGDAFALAFRLCYAD